MTIKMEPDSYRTITELEEYIVNVRREIQPELFTEKSLKRGRALKLKDLGAFFSEEAIVYLIISYWLYCLNSDEIELELTEKEVSYVMILADFAAGEVIPEEGVSESTYTDVRLVLIIILLTKIFAYADLTNDAEDNAIWVSEVEMLFDTLVLEASSLQDVFHMEVLGLKDRYNLTEYESIEEIAIKLLMIGWIYQIHFQPYTRRIEEFWGTGDKYNMIYSHIGKSVHAMY